MLFLRLVFYEVHHKIQSYGPDGLENASDVLLIWNWGVCVGVSLKNIMIAFHLGQVPEVQLDSIIKDSNDYG